MAGAADEDDAIDIKALLDVALEPRPREDVSERVVGRMAALVTITEFVRLLGAAPLSSSPRPIQTHETTRTRTRTIAMMMMSMTLTPLEEIALQPAQALWAAIVEQAPAVFTAALLMLVMWAVARIARG